MDIKYINEISSAMHDFMNSHGFSSENQEVGTWNGEGKTYKVAYLNERKSFCVSVSTINAEGETIDFNELSSWYFDVASHGANDTKCIAEDFIKAIAKDNNIKIVTTADKGFEEIALPKKAEVGTEPNVEAFTQKFLAMFPQYKDTYKAMMVKYGDFLYVEFYKNYGIEKMKELMADESKNKKLLQKYWKMLGEMHYEGDSTVGDIICTVIIAGTFFENPAAFTAAADKYLADYPFLKSAARASVLGFKKNKKLRKALNI